MMSSAYHYRGYTCIMVNAFKPVPRKISCGEEGWLKGLFTLMSLSHHYISTIVWPYGIANAPSLQYASTGLYQLDLCLAGRHEVVTRFCLWEPLISEHRFPDSSGIRLKGLSYLRRESTTIDQCRISRPCCV